MESHNDELNKRRQQRRERQQQRQREQKKFTATLVIAAVVLISCGILIFAVAQSARQGSSQSTQPPEHISQTGETGGTTEPSTEPTGPATVITLAAVGDVNINDKTVAAGAGAVYDYTNTFVDVLPLLSEADLTLMNFEGNLCGEPYGTATVSAPQELMEALYNAGVDVVQMANSRCINNGDSGLATTLQNIRAAGMLPVGAYASKSEFKRTGGYTICDIQGIKIAFVAFTKGMDGYAIPEQFDGHVNLLYTDYATMYKEVDTSGIRKVLRAAAKEKPDITIALLHWGSEYSDKENKTQATIKDLMIDEGVDAIIGTHPHYVQKMEIEKETGAFVAYSLGDFYSDAQRAGSEYSVVLHLEITKDHITGETKVTNFEYTPIFTMEGIDGKLKVVRLQEQIDQYLADNVRMVNDQTYSAMVYGLKRAHERVGKLVEGTAEETVPPTEETTAPTETTGAATETTGETTVETTAETTAESTGETTASA
ncbi:MAG: CapA family protein [Oscillospiraceae bacterium]|nr:CapA family protein [Oscillospiraceae bacterium]